MRDRGVEALLPVRVTGSSMRPGLRPGDLCLVLRGGPVQAGDVVALHLPGRVQVGLVVKRAAHRRDGGWWVLGDDAAASTDSRTVGVVPDGDVVGRVVLRYWPPRGPSAARTAYRARQSS